MALRVRMGRTRAETQRAQSGGDLLATPAIGLVGCKRRILGHRGHRVHREILPSPRQPPLQPDFFQIGKELCLCVLGDLCGKNLLTRARPKISLGRNAGSPDRKQHFHMICDYRDRRGGGFDIGSKKKIKKWLIPICTWSINAIED